MLEPDPAVVKVAMAPPLLRTAHHVFPFINCVIADDAHAGDRIAIAPPIIVEIVAKRPNQIGFAVLPRRRLIERFLARLGRNRRLAEPFRPYCRPRQSPPLTHCHHAAVTPPRKASMTFETNLHRGPKRS